MYLFLPFSFKKINVLILIGGSLLYDIVTVFALHQHESAKVTHVSPPSWTPFPPPTPPSPTGVSKSTGFGCPVSCIELALVISVACVIVYCCFLVAQSCPTLCNPRDCSMPGFPVLHYLPELAQTHIYQVSDAIKSIGCHPKYWIFGFGIRPSSEYSGLISLGMIGLIKFL